MYILIIHGDKIIKFMLVAGGDRTRSLIIYNDFIHFGNKYRIGIRPLATMPRARSRRVDIEMFRKSRVFNLFFKNPLRQRRAADIPETNE